MLTADRAEATRRLITDQEKAVAVAIEVCYLIVTEDMPMAKFTPIMSLLHRLQTPNVATLNVSKGISYNTTYAFLEFLAAMNSVIMSIKKD